MTWRSQLNTNLTKPLCQLKYSGNKQRPNHSFDEKTARIQLKYAILAQESIILNSLL